jgi:hypothetical protein
MSERINIYQMYVKNNCKLGFYVRSDKWRQERFAKVVEIQHVEDGKMIEGEPPYYGGFKYPAGHPKEGIIMGPRLVTLEADWLDGGVRVTDRGGNYSWEQVYPDENK